MFYLKLGTTAGTLEKVVALIGLGVGWLFGGWTETLTALLVLQGLDLITGVLAGTKNKELSSFRMREGLITKVGYWLAIVLANVVDGVLFDGQMIVQTAVIFPFLAVEGLSVIENLGIMGVAIHKQVTQYLEQVRNKGDISEKTIGKYEGRAE